MAAHQECTNKCSRARTPTVAVNKHTSTRHSLREVIHITIKHLTEYRMNALLLTASIKILAAGIVDKILDSSL
jgi:hypothetical protein